MTIKKEIEEYNYFTCPVCDPQAITRLNIDEFKKHLSEKHNITSLIGTRKMMKHIDAADWYATEYEVTIEGNIFLQYTKDKRHGRM